MKRAAVGLAVLGMVHFSMAESVPVRVLSDRVNLRAAPQMTAEVVAQVDENDVLQAREIGAEWVEVVTPTNVDGWIHREFYVDGRVNVKKLNVRAGPGINYKVLGEMRRNDPVEVRGEFGEWLKIAPPPESSVWISSAYVETARPGNREPMGSDTAHERYQTKPDSAEWQTSGMMTSAEPRQPDSDAQRGDSGEIRVRPKPQVQRTISLPPDWKLIPLEGQGKVVEVEGILKTVGFMIKRPTRYRMVHYDHGHTEMICYVWGNDAQLEGYLGQSLTLKGRQYWVHGYRSPILVVEQVALPQAEPEVTVPLTPQEHKQTMQRPAPQPEQDFIEPSTPGQPYN